MSMLCSKRSHSGDSRDYGSPNTTLASKSFELLDYGALGQGVASGSAVPDGQRSNEEMQYNKPGVS